MTPINDTYLNGRPSGARRPGAGRMATRRTRTRVSSDAVVSAYIRDLARPHSDDQQHDPTFSPSPPESSIMATAAATLT